MLAALGLLLSLFAFAQPAAASDHKVILCHATNSLDNPYVAIEISEAGLEAGHKADNGDFHINAKTGLQDFLLANTELEACDDVPDTEVDLEVTPLAPTVGAATCAAAGTLTLTAVEGVSYSIDPAYTAGLSGAFTVTASAEEGYVIATGATTVFNVVVAAQLNCVAAVAPSVSAATCAAPGALTINAVTGVTYSVSPAYTAGASGSFTVTASAAAGYTLTGPTVFVANVPAQLVCQSGTLGGNPTPTPSPAAPAAPVRSGTLAGALPNTAMGGSAVDQAPIALLALLALGSLAYVAQRNIGAIKNRR